jgi:fructokinase
MIVVAGEALIDLVAGVPVVGGSPANVAVTLARQGQPVRLLARHGNDGYGQQIRSYLDGNGVDRTWAIDGTEPTSLAIATPDANGSATYEFRLDGGADWQWRHDELPDLRPSPAIAFHTGSLALAMRPGAAVIEDFLATSHAAATVTTSVDLNLRPSIRPDRAAERTRVERQIGFAHIVKASDEDLEWLYPGVPVEQVAQDWYESGVAASIVTRGADGVYMVGPDGIAYRRPGRRITVVDTVGAGDSFTGALLASLSWIDALGRSPVTRLAAVAPEQWITALDYAVRVSAITCTRRGANPPTLAEMTEPAV